MSSEIVPFVDGSDTPSAEPHDDNTGKGKAAVVQHLTDSDAILRRPLGAIEDVRPFDLLGVRSVKGPTFKFDLISGNQLDMRHFVPPEKGPKCVTKLNPNPKSVKPLLERMKEPSVLQLRGCDQLFSMEASPFPFEKFKTLTCLEISGLSILTTFPENTISEMSHLQILNLSHLPIKQLPTDFFSKHVRLRSLTLKDCPNIHSLPKLPQMTALNYLELSHLLIATLPEGCFSNLENLKRVILRGCSILSSLPSIQPLQKLRELDLSHCTALQETERIGYLSVYFRKLDLSYTALQFTSTLVEITWITHLFLRDAKVINFEGIRHLEGLKVLDVSGAQYVKDLDLLKRNEELEALDLSRTGIESIDFISDLMNLRYLILRDCTRLQKLPAMEKLKQLEVLDISGCEILSDLPEDISSLKMLKELNLSGCSALKELRPGLFDEMTFLEKVDISKTNINHLPSFASLTYLPTLNISQTSVKEIPTCLQTVTNLAAAPSESRIENLHRRLSKPNEFYIVSTFFINSGFDRFKQDFDLIVDLISRIQENFEPVSSLDTIPIHTAMDYGFIRADAASCPIGSRTVKMQCRRMVSDLKYIRDNIGLLESCTNCTSAEVLLDELTDRYCSTSFFSESFPKDLSQFHVRLHSTNFYEVLMRVVKLKQLVPPKQVDALEEIKYKKTERFKGRGGLAQHCVRDIDINTPEMQNLSSSYESLTNTLKNCLLHFTVFMCYEAIKERMLIQLWYGEGLIDPQNEENVGLSNANSTTNPELTSASTEAGTTTNGATRVSLQVSTAHTIEEIGRKILMVLEEKGFIGRSDPLDPKESRMWIMRDYAHSFVRARAMAEGFFDVDHETRMLTPHLTGSQRACLLISENNLPSSCKLWADYINSSEKIKCFKTIRTLLNVNVLIVDIKAEWFSKMRNLSVFHLGRCQKYEDLHESIDVMDLKFLEELKNMKQLRLLNLEGFSTIKKLPDSVCKATNLKTLNLRDCSYLEELPSGIGSLKNLTHLDLTDCPVLSMLPKGIRLLSKLEVLKGFVIYYQIGGRQHRNACTLRDLLKLEKLRILKLVVHTEGFPFPDSSDLHVFNGMKNLCSLQIIWQHNYNDLDQQHQDIVGQKASSRWHQLKCWEQRTHQNDTEELLRSNIKKLELRCFPFETASNWLHPSGLQKLEKLYVRGGKLKTLARDTSQNTWSVKTLVLEYLPNMYMDPKELRCNFPHMTYFEAFQCDHLSTRRGEIKLTSEGLIESDSD